MPLITSVQVGLLNVFTLRRICVKCKHFTFIDHAEQCSSLITKLACFMMATLAAVFLVIIIGRSTRWMTETSFLARK